MLCGWSRLSPLYTFVCLLDWRYEKEKLTVQGLSGPMLNSGVQLISPAIRSTVFHFNLTLFSLDKTVRSVKIESCCAQNAASCAKHS